MNLRQLLLVDIGFDPHLTEVGNGEECVARVDVLPLRHLALDHAAGRGGIQRCVRNAVRRRRSNLFFTNAPKLQFALACVDQCVCLGAYARIVGVAQLLAILLRQAIIFDCRSNLGTIYVSDRLTAPNALAGVLHVEFIDASADARAHCGKLRFGLFHTAKRINVRLQRRRTNLGDLNSRRRNLRRSQFQSCTRLRTLIAHWLRHGSGLLHRHRTRWSLLRCVGVSFAHNQNCSDQYGGKNSCASSHY